MLLSNSRGVVRAFAWVLLAVASRSATAADVKNELLNRVVRAAETKLRSCGQALHAQFGLESGSLRWIRYVVGPNISLCRDMNNVALGRVGEPLIVLCTPQFWRKAEQDEEEAVYFLIHEYLHTRGVREWPNGGDYDSVAITRIVREACKDR